jgi:hypothetical protein
MISIARVLLMLMLLLRVGVALKVSLLEMTVVDEIGLLLLLLMLLDGIIYWLHHHLTIIHIA